MGGGDKALVDLGGRPMLDRVVARLRGQARPLVLNANGDPARFDRFGLPVVADPVDGFVGPLAGLLAVLRWARETSNARWIATVPADTPFIPRNLVERLLEGLGTAEISIARSREMIHPVVGLWPVAVADGLCRWLRDGEHRAMHRWIETRTTALVDFEDEGEFDPFFNVNTPADLRVAAGWAKEGA
jgi:molybdopterin-guanine dinucleotide biosynthesis protein A